MTTSTGNPDINHLRKWQSEAIRTYFTGPRKDFTVTATPGAGKTTYALTTAKQLLNQKIVDRIIVVAPTDHLRTQWAQAATKFGIQLDPKLGNNQKLKPAMNGYVTTYAQVASHPLLHQRRTELPNRTLVILDEIHHAGDGLSWGEAIREAFTDATRRISLTGTPFRTSREQKIPFVTYSEDNEGQLRSVSDFGYGYADALADHVVRPVVFAAYSGVASWRTSAGEILSADLSEPSTKKQEALAWRAALNPAGKWVPHVIRAANDRITELRATGVPDAGCLVLASDQDAARAYAKVVTKVTGHTPVVVLSDDPAASKKIAAFDGSKDRFLVAVRMVSEGVDVQRLCCLVWLTSYQTPLFFAQAVGRVLRARNRNETATVFLPSVRPLLTLAAEMEKARDHVLSPPPAEEENAKEFEDSRPTETPGGEQFESVSAEARFGHVLFAGKAIVPDTRNTLTVEEEEYLGLPGLLSPEQSALLLAQREVDKRKQNPKNGPRVIPPQTLSDDSIALRKEIVSLVNRWAAKENIPVPQAHMLVRNSVPGPKNADASLHILRQRRDWLLARTT